MNKIADELLSFIINAFIDGGVSKLMEQNKKNKLDELCKEIEYRINEEINKKYEGEIYFDRISRFFTTNKIVEYIFSCILDMTNESSIEALLLKYSNNFVENFPDLLVYKNDVRKILDNVYIILKSEIKKSNIINDEKEILFYIIEYSKRSNEKLNILLNMTTIVNEKLDSLNEKISNINNKSDLTATTDKIISDVNLGGEFSIEIKRIEDNYQQKYLFKEAINEYMLLLSDILSTNSKNNEVIGAIYLNLTLCATNLKSYDLADKHLLTAEKYCNSNDAKLHYIYGYLLWKKSNINAALNKIDEAIKCDNKHYSARLLRCVLLAQEGNDALEINLELDKIITDIPKDNIDKIAEYYRTKGLVCKFLNDYENAIDYTKKSDDLVNDVINKINIGIIYYNWALKDNLQDGKRKLKIRADYEKLLTALDIFKTLLSQENIENQIEPYRDEIISFYVSSCELCYKFENIDAIELSDTSDLDYEIARSIIFRKILNGNQALVSELTELDRKFYEICDLSIRDINSAVSIIEESLNEISYDEYYRYYNIYLQLLLELKNLDKYKLVRSKVIDFKLEIPHLELYDAKYNELCGNYKEAKAYYDKKIMSFDDEMFLNQALEFYENYMYEEELLNLYEISINKIIEHELVHHNIKYFMILAFNKLSISRLEETFAMFEKLDIVYIGEEAYYKIQYNLYSKISHVEKMLEANRFLQKHEKSLESEIDEVILLKLALQFDEGICKAEKLKKFAKNKDQKIVIYEILSELYLLVGNNEKSIEYITCAKDEAQELIFDPVHNLYMNRLLRCGNDNGIKYGIDFLEKFPNTTNWIKQITTLEKDINGNEVLTEEIISFLSSQEDKYKLFLDYYKKGVITTYQVSELYSIDLFMAFNWHFQNGIKLHICSGNIEELNDINLTTDVIVDVLTLIFLEKYDLWDALSVFEKIYFTYSNVAEIEKLYFFYNNEVIKNVLVYVKKSLKIILIPNYSVLKTIDYKYHPNYFIDSLVASDKMRINFFIIDSITHKYFDGMYNISIISIIKKIKDQGDKKLAAEMIFKLINSNITFVNFNAFDLFYAYKKCNSFKAQLMKPYFNIKSSCDTDSFIGVYMDVISLIGSEFEKEVMYDFVGILLHNLDKIWNRAKNLKIQYNSFCKEEDINKCKIYSSYVYRLLVNLFFIFKGKDEYLKFILDYQYKYLTPNVPQRIFELSQVDTTNNLT